MLAFLRLGYSDVFQRSVFCLLCLHGGSGGNSMLKMHAEGVAMLACRGEVQHWMLHVRQRGVALGLRDSLRKSFRARTGN